MRGPQRSKAGSKGEVPRPAIDSGGPHGASSGPRRASRAPRAPRKSEVPHPACESGGPRLATRGPQLAHTRAPRCQDARGTAHGVSVRAGLGGPQERGHAYTVRFGRASTGLKSEVPRIACDSRGPQRASIGPQAGLKMMTGAKHRPQHVIRHISCHLEARPTWDSIILN